MFLAVISIVFIYMCVYITKDQVGVVYIQAAPDVSMKACIENNNNKSFFLEGSGFFEF